MDGQPVAQTRAPVLTPAPAFTLKPVPIGLRSRILVRVLGWFLRRWLAWVMRGPLERLARTQLSIAGRPCRDSAGLQLAYRLLGRAPRVVPGHVLGDLGAGRGNVILYIHGGAFVLPAAPDQHVRFVAKLCRALDAAAFLPDYRLAPLNRFPAPLDDCEWAYRALLDLGFEARRIVVAGESAGGTLALGLLQRIRARGWPMPACVVPISPAADTSRIHGLPARTARMRSDPVLAIGSLSRLGELYVGDHDTADPELSPLYADFAGLPPLYFIAADNEVLRDDALTLAECARRAGVSVETDVWPVLPHAFPILEQMFPEAATARADIVAFAQRYLPKAL
ncbi:MAG TPA: alpha/beta hydrolase [Nevskiaceae bacterium]|nr:alpha/beta hydrolase [Nevskiaceae bacterium]